MRTFCETVLYECLAHEKAEVLPSYLRLYHLLVMLTQLVHSLPIHSVRMLSAYYASPTLAGMRTGLLEAAAASSSDVDPAATEPLLQPTFIHSLCAQLDALFSSLSFDAQLGRRGSAGGGRAGAGGAQGSAVGAQAGALSSGTAGLGQAAATCALVGEGQRRILYGAFLAHHGIRPSSHLPASGAAGAELLPFIMAQLMANGGAAAGGDPRGLHATALRIATLGAMSRSG